MTFKCIVSLLLNINKHEPIKSFSKLFEKNQTVSANKVNEYITTKEEAQFEIHIYIVLHWGLEIKMNKIKLTDLSSRELEG